MSRFDSEQYVMNYYHSGRYPDIHTDIFKAVSELSKGNCFIDLCCSTGLLGTRLLEFGMQGVGVEGDKKAIQVALTYKVPLKIYNIKLEQGNLPDLVRVIQEKRATILVARRCFPELFGDNHSFGSLFIDTVHSAGIKEIFLEGRKPVANPSNSLDIIDKEIDICSSRYVLRKKSGAVAYLYESL